MKIYARQIPPEYQESPLFLGDESFPDNIAVYGNRDYNAHMPDFFKRVFDALYNGDLLEAWEDINDGGRGYYYNWASALVMLVPPEGRDAYTREERKHKWPDVARRYYNACRGSFEEDQALCDALELVTGKAWATGAIRGCCQGDWQNICYPVEEWNRESLDAFEAEYFNTGTEWIVHDGDDVPEGPEDINGFSVYCYGWRGDDIRAEIANAYGAPGAEVVLYKIAGQHTVYDWEVAQ